MEESTKRKYRYTITIDVERTDDSVDFCIMDSTSSEVCEGGCGSECETFFAKKMQSFLSGCDKDFVHFYSSEIERVTDHE